MEHAPYTRLELQAHSSLLNGWKRVKSSRTNNLQEFKLECVEHIRELKQYAKATAWIIPDDWTPVSKYRIVKCEITILEVLNAKV